MPSPEPTTAPADHADAAAAVVGARAGVAVLVDHAGDRVQTATRELLDLAHRLASEAGAGAEADQATGVTAIWCGDAPDAGALAVLAEHGATTVLHPDLGDVDPHLTAAVVDGVLAALALARPAVLLTASTFEAKEVAARVGVATGSGVVSDTTGVSWGDGGDVVVADKTVFAGTWTTRCAVTSAMAVVTLKAGSARGARAATPGAPAPAVVVVPVEPGAAARAVVLEGRTELPVSDRPGLAEADVVVVGGRGTGGDFTPLEELADALGGAVGATRVATDEGWIAHEAQIGQTGVTINPHLYIGAGVSGAVHHRGGMQASGTVVAINEDPDAPIFEIADFGVVGDIFTVLPQLTAEVLRRRAGS